MKKPHFLIVLMVVIMSVQLNADAQTFTANGVEISFESMSTDAQILNGAGGTITLKLKANGKWTLEPDCDWITVKPTTGKKGRHTISITTANNPTGHDRMGQITLNGDQTQIISICQRPYIYERKQVAKGTVTNAVNLTYSGTQWTRIYTVLPYPRTNMYQDIESVKTYYATVYDCPDGLNSYIATNYQGNSIPTSGTNVIKEDISAIVYEVTARLDLIDNIPPYDPKSDECMTYLGKERGNIIDPTHKTIIAISDFFWAETAGNIIDYARKCYEWTATNIKYGNQNKGLRPISEILNNKVSDCGNFASVFISLLRAKGIPARHIVMIEPDKNNWHVRAEFYIPAYGWIPVDPTYKNSNPRGDYFGKFTGKFLVMSTGVNLSIKGPDGNDINEPLLQTYIHWEWWMSEGSYNFNHSFSKFE